MTSYSYIEAELVISGTTEEHHIFESDGDVQEWYGRLAIEYLRIHATEDWETLVIHHPHPYHGGECDCAGSESLTERKRIVP